MSDTLHPTEVKARLIRDFGSVTAFERTKKLAPQSVRDVLRGKPSRRTAAAIADAIGLTLEQLFPGRFGEGAGDHKSQNQDSHRLNAEAL
jgi:lambda repressor-like predicted transcriptional regulator